MIQEPVHPNDCGNCKRWHKWTDEEWEYHCRAYYDKYSRKRPEARYNLGYCDGPLKKSVYHRDGFKYGGYSFANECYDEILHCFEVKDDNH